MQTYKVSKTDKQRIAVATIKQNQFTLLEGGSRSGKTFIALYVICLRALMYPGTKHLVCRFRFAHAKQAICYETMPRVLDALGIRSYTHLNRSDWFYELDNGSTIWIGGLDEKERIEKILGNEYATIFANEASQIVYPSIEVLITRLNPPTGVRGRFLIDYNPPSKRHWGYVMFHKRQYPDGRPLPDTDYAVVRMNPQDNPHNSPEYVETLQTLSTQRQKRFLFGEYADDIDGLWQREWIRYGKLLLDPERVVVGVDPTGSVHGDEAGIVVAAKHGNTYSVLADYSMHGTPAQWAAEVVRAYRVHNADLVVAERNFGGDMVRDVIKNSGDVNVKLVTATRGKVVRAEPIAALYEEKRVQHIEPMPELEDELCTYDGTGDSPNRLDALVWTLTELSSEMKPTMIGYV